MRNQTHETAYVISQSISIWTGLRSNQNCIDIITTTVTVNQCVRVRPPKFQWNISLPSLIAWITLKVINLNDLPCEIKEKVQLREKVHLRESVRVQHCISQLLWN